MFSEGHQRFRDSVEEETPHKRKGRDTREKKENALCSNQTSPRLKLI